MRSAYPFAGLVAVVVALSSPAAAERLPVDACEALKSEQDQLAEAGTRNDMLQGPAWARANLPAARLARIRRLIEVEEQIAFRCAHPRAAAGAAPAAAADAGEAAEPATPVRKVKKKARRAKVEAPPEAEQAADDTAADAARAQVNSEATAAPVPKKKRVAKPPADTAVGTGNGAPPAVKAQ